MCFAPLVFVAYFSTRKTCFSCCLKLWLTISQWLILLEDCCPSLHKQCKTTHGQMILQAGNFLHALLQEPSYYLICTRSWQCEIIEVCTRHHLTKALVLSCVNQKSAVVSTLAANLFLSMDLFHTGSLKWLLLCCISQDGLLKQIV